MSASDSDEGPVPLGEGSEDESDEMDGRRQRREKEVKGEGGRGGHSHPGKAPAEDEYSTENSRFVSQDADWSNSGSGGGARRSKGGGNRVLGMRKTLKERWEESQSLEEILDEITDPGLSCRAGTYFEGMGRQPEFDDKLAYGSPIGCNVEGPLKTVHSNATQAEKRLWIAAKAGVIQEVKSVLCPPITPSVRCTLAMSCWDDELEFRPLQKNA